VHGVHRIGLQFHPEWDTDLVDRLNLHFGSASPLPRDTRSTAQRARDAAVGQWWFGLLDRWWGD
jgi:hypothetical protein